MSTVAGAPLRLSAGQIASFERDGFVNGGAVLDASAVAELSAELDRVLELGPEYYQGQLYRPALFRNAVAEGTDPMWQIVNMWAVSEAFRRLAYNPALTSMVAQLRASAAGLPDPGNMAPADSARVAGEGGGHGTRGDDSIVLFHDQIQYKPPNGGGATTWHQDSTLDWQRWDEAWVCTAWLALDDVDAGMNLPGAAPILGTGAARHLRVGGVEGGGGGGRLWVEEERRQVHALHTVLDLCKHRARERERGEERERGGRQTDG